MFWILGHEARGILAPRPGIEPKPPALESEVLTTGRPGKSYEFTIFLTDLSPTKKFWKSVELPNNSV